MINLDKEAEEYSNNWDNINNLDSDELSPFEASIIDFKAGANSKYVEAKILQAQIDILEGVDGEFYYSRSIVNCINELQQKLKDLENGRIYNN